MLFDFGSICDFNGGWSNFPEVLWSKMFWPVLCADVLYPVVFVSTILLSDVLSDVL